MSVQLLGIDEATLDGFLAPSVDPFAPFGQPSRIDRLLGRLPNVAHHNFDLISAAGATWAVLAAGALRQVGVVLPIAFPTGRAIRQLLSTRTSVAVASLVIDVLPLVEVALTMGRPAVAVNVG